MVLVGGAAEGPQRAELIERARMRGAERPGASLGAEGPVTDHPLQSELMQVSHVGLLLVDEQAVGAFAADPSQPAHSWITRA